MAGDEPLSASLEVVKGAQPGARLALGPSSSTLGRATGNTHVIADTTMSRQHAKIFLRDGRHWIADSNSSHGTFVNGTRITLQTLVDGDEIKLGGTVLRYVEAAPAKRVEPPAPQAPLNVASLAPPKSPPSSAPAPKLVPPDAGTGSFELELPEADGSPAMRGPLPPIATGYRRALTDAGEDPFADETRAEAPPEKKEKKKAPEPAPVARSSTPAIEMRGETARQFASRASGQPVAAAAASRSSAHVPPPLAAATRRRGPLSFLRDELDQRGAAARVIATLFALALAGALFWVALTLFGSAPKPAPAAPPEDDGAPRPTGAPMRPVLPERH